MSNSDSFRSKAEKRAWSFLQDGLQASDFSIDSAYFEDLYSQKPGNVRLMNASTIAFVPSKRLVAPGPTMLANLLLITPVFYSLLMFRTSKAMPRSRCGLLLVSGPRLHGKHCV